MSSILEMVSLSKLQSGFHLFALLSISLLLPATVFAQAKQAQISPQMQQRSMLAARSAIKLELQPANPTAVFNTPVSVDILLRNSDNQPASWGRPCNITLQVTFPSKKVATQTVVIPFGQSSVRATFVASEAGIITLRASESSNSLLAAGNTVYILPPTKSKPLRARHSASHGASVQEYWDLPSLRARLVYASLQPSPSYATSYPEPQAPDSVTAPLAVPIPATPQLLLINSTGKEEILSDGKDYARITVYYMDPDGKPAPSEILLWMTWDHGTFSPQPLVIHKGRQTAEGTLVSESAVISEISIARAAPSVPVQGNSTLKIAFVPPIYGFGPATSEQVVHMSLIDREPIMGQFFDGQGHCVQTSRKREVHFSTTNPTLHIEPGSLNVESDSCIATVFLEPTWPGTATLEMWTPGYERQSIAVVISIWLVIVLCLIGGAVGGAVAKDTTKGSIWWRLFVGVVGAIVIVWFLVLAVVPQTHSMIAHSLISVFVVGIIGGYSGTQGIDFVAKKLGIFT